MLGLMGLVTIGSSGGGIAAPPSTGPEAKKNVAPRVTPSNASPKAQQLLGVAPRRAPVGTSSKAARVLGVGTPSGALPPVGTSSKASRLLGDGVPTGSIKQQ